LPDDGLKALTQKETMMVVRRESVRMEWVNGKEAGSPIACTGRR